MVLVSIWLGVVAFGSPLEDSVEALVRAVRDHQAALGRLLELQTKEVARAEAEVLRRRELAARDLIARADVIDAETQATAARARADETTAEIARADTLVTEAQAAVALARVPPPPPGVELRTDTHVVFGGGSRWSLTRVPAIEQFFATRFGRSLPVSAYGQTPLHDRLGFDHKNALDVAVHPDTPEGKVLLDYLRKERIPFIAFRSAERGAATGAHVHIGAPSAKKPERRADAGAAR
jgi:hypothetical protein